MSDNSLGASMQRTFLNGTIERIACALNLPLSEGIRDRQQYWSTASRTVARSRRNVSEITERFDWANVIALTIIAKAITFHLTLGDAAEAQPERPAMSQGNHGETQSSFPAHASRPGLTLGEHRWMR